MLDVNGILDNAFPLSMPTSSLPTPGKDNTTAHDVYSARDSSQRPAWVLVKDFTAACKWLAKHFFNPYPSPSVKKELAGLSDISAKSMDDWFTVARRKIGWTAFSKRYFQSNRSLALDCAHRVFVEGSKHHSYCQEIVHDLEKIKVMAEHFYVTANRNTHEPSYFAKELDNISTQTVELASRPVYRRLSTSSTSSSQVSVSQPSSIYPLSRKRLRNNNESNEAFNSGGLCLSRPCKRSRSMSSPSRESSLTSCSSESNVTLHELITPVSSPNHPNLPLELFDGWMDSVSAESTFLPHDVADKPPSVLSHKRALSDSEEEGPTKRIRLEKNNEPPFASHGLPTVSIVKSMPIAPTNQTGLLPPCPSLTRCQASVTLSLADSHPGDKTGAEFDEDTLNLFISELDFSIPEAPISIWDESLSNSVLETSLFDFSSLDPGKRLSSGHSYDLNELSASIPVTNAPLTASEDALLAACAPQQNVLSLSNASSGLISDAHNLSMAAQSTSCNPISFSALDLEFLESLGIAPQPQPQDAPSSSAHNQDVPTTLVDVPSSSQLADLAISGPELANKLVSEAYRLPQEVFG
ncbi:uncharacterized protein FOMMEDRAFT_120732 [Fomitiporia mediterranea MF3/22]|uniref:uncharacterized protein n=1 Tax=Fomitiporia mediterranea (strain MF3/22) TaxID=694068 RepID=UPI00044087E0|nr:uncharacterized protein FOMMEDRAFT_120732 [Fomitiporia mediterranea MF3/22]EJD03585.1 hypothetical protein FOMMEDRAFT_120732 [Fomitiporia mediterranea MF3/22]